MIAHISITLVNQHVLSSLEENWLEDATSLIVPLVLQDLEILAGPLLDFDVGVVCVRINDLFDFLEAASHTNCQLGECSQGPLNDHITSLALAVVFIEDLLVDFNDLIFRYGARRSIGALGRAINQHLTELTAEPATQLNHAHLVNVFLHGKVDLRYAVRV